MLKFLSLASGSNGNCYYFSKGETSFVVDMGIGPRTLKQRLLLNGINPDTIGFALLTHDHVDHTNGLVAFCKRASVPVYSTPEIHRALPRHTVTRDISNAYLRMISKDTPIVIQGIKVTPFEVPHDAAQTLGYMIETEGVKIVLITDVGEMIPEAEAYCRQANYLILEANFDQDMLINGPYPEDLKARIFNGRGHLSNHKCARSLCSVMHPELKSVFLCHLSEHNNTPELAYNTVSSALKNHGHIVGRDLKLYCLPRKEASPVFCLE